METLNLNEENRIFNHKLMRVGLPVLIQQVISIGLNLVDTIMVGKVSETALAAVGAANQVYFIYGTLLFGIFSGASVHAVQYWGVGDLKSLRKIVGIDYLMCFLLTLPALVLVYAMGPQVIGLFTDDKEVILLGNQYMHIVGFSYLFAAISFVITYNSRSIQDLTVPTTINAIAIGINIFLNYGLIYGHFGMAPMGVEGAALATLIARVVEAVAMVTSIYARKTHPLKATFRQLTGFSRQMFQSVMKTAVPVVINEGLWAVSVSMTLAAYGKIGPSALAIVQVATTVTEFFQTVYFGVGNASAVIIGEALGQGRKKRAWRYSRRIMKITWGLNVIMTLLIIFLRQPIAIIYDFDTATTEMMMKTLLIYAIAMAPKMLAYMTICAILRAGGDTLYCMWLDSVFNMVVQVPLAFFSVMVLNLELHWAVALVAVADFVKVIFCYQRYFSRKWMNVITDVDILEED